MDLTVWYDSRSSRSLLADGIDEKLCSSERVGDDRVFVVCFIGFFVDCGWDKWTDDERREANSFIRALLIGLGDGDVSVLGIEYSDFGFSISVSSVGEDFLTVWSNSVRSVFLLERVWFAIVDGEVSSYIKKKKRNNFLMWLFMREKKKKRSKKRK